MLTKEAAKAEADALNSQSVKQKKSTLDSMKQDQTALTKLDAACDDADVTFNVHMKHRYQELQAVGDAVAMLTAQGVSARASNGLKKSLLDVVQEPEPFFLQISSKSDLKFRRHQAMKILKSAGAHSATLALLAHSVRGLKDVSKVIKAVDKLSVQLTTQQADEVKVHASCKKREADNAAALKSAKDEQASIAGKLASLNSKEGITKLALAGNQNKTNDKNAMLAGKLSARNKENAIFKQLLQDQMATVDVLNKAVDRLLEFYGKGAPPSFAQTEDTEAAPGPLDSAKKPPSKIGTNDIHKKEGGVVVLVRDLIKKAKLVMKEAKADEAKAVKVYEDLVKATGVELKTVADEKLELTRTKVKVDIKQRYRKADKKANDALVTALSKTDADLEKECRFLLTNFAARQKARLAEINSLKEVKTTLKMTA